jgi:prepilin-type processing-associated H-X9-DG protein
LDEPWDSPHNRQLISKMPATYQDPQAQASPGYTCYVAPYEKGTAWSGGALQLRQITDGTSNTLSFLQVAGPSAVPWTSPDDLDVTGMSPAQFLPRNGGNASWMDGSVRFLSPSIDIKVFRALLTHQGGEVVNLD